MQIPARRLVTPVLAVLATSVPLAGCGGSDPEAPGEQKPDTTVSGDQRGILGTVEALQTASRANDGKGICTDIFTAQLVRSIETTAKRSCVKEVSDTLVSPKAAISVGRDIEVSGVHATATIREQNNNVSKLFLLKQDGKWRIDRVVAQKQA
jgi:hypothetical protein